MSLAVKNAIWMEARSNVNKVLSKFSAAGETLTFGDGTTAVSQTNGAMNIGADATLYIAGSIIADALPTSDPGVAGQFWNDSGAVKVSNG